MKSSNLAWRIEPQEDAPASPPATSPEQEPPRRATPRPSVRARFERRTIEIRDQGFAPFRVR